MRPVSGIPLNTQAAPTGVTVSQYVVVDQGIAKTNMTLYWTASPGAVAYVAQWQKDNGDWVDAGRTGGTSIDVHNIYQGAYTLRVRAINGLDVSSVYAYSAQTTLAGKTGAPPTVSSRTSQGRLPQHSLLPVLPRLLQLSLACRLPSRLTLQL